MVISNAKYNKKVAGMKNRAGLAGLDEDDLGGIQGDTTQDFQNWVIPRYEEMRFLSVDELAH
jgi:hypothetical protein